MGLEITPTLLLCYFFGFGSNRYDVIILGENFSKTIERRSVQVRLFQIISEKYINFLK